MGDTVGDWKDDEGCWSNTVTAQRIAHLRGFEHTSSDMVELASLNVQRTVV